MAEERHGTSTDVRRWPKAQHLQRMIASGRFRHCRELLMHQIEPGNAERLAGMALSQGSVAALINHGLSEGDIGLTELRQTARRFLGDNDGEWWFSYRVRIGTK